MTPGLRLHMLFDLFSFNVSELRVGPCFTCFDTFSRKYSDFSSREKTQRCLKADKLQLFFKCVWTQNRNTHLFQYHVCILRASCLIYDFEGFIREYKPSCKCRYINKLLCVRRHRRVRRVEAVKKGLSLSYEESERAFFYFLK